ncbi:heavy-metal-associated domain-containing protein [Geobacter sp.]|uniref:heavy-metal-associated domain-containing protein n=1 Tax=Geobacter sp. TaxID=46610 RepID=UPI00260B8EC4|nr:heavy-metal-associated domain-containing protein [Geobacter sp.]
MVLRKVGKMFRLLTVVVLGLVLGAVTAFSSDAPDTVTVLKSSGLSCGGCASKIDKALKAAPGVSSLEVDIDSGQVTIWHDSTAVSPEKLAETVSSAGYQSTVLETMSAESYREKSGKSGPAADRRGGCGGCCDRTKSTERS